MIELIPYKAEHAIEVIANRAQQPGLKITGLIEQWAKHKESVISKTVILGNKIIGCGGIEICWPGMAEAWAVSVYNLSDYLVNPRKVKHQLHAWIKEHNLIRVQAPMRTDFPVGIRFAEFLGFKPDGWPEVPKGVLMENYHPDGVSAIMYSIIGV
ncbi:hypothetical protein LCGC14_0858120 [marine sediment metagenome]|uniref:N-acetyltransferase domain-containing protein n=1 Tax=marine sediment metagenome TaxID=412755 RepID=A0A0F9RST0_9ZZZZ